MPLAPGTTRIRDSITAKNFVPCAECTAPVPLGVGACGACKEAVCESHQIRLVVEPERRLIAFALVRWLNGDGKTVMWNVKSW